MASLEKKDKPKLFDGGVKKVYHGGNVERYENLINENKLLFTADLVKEKISDAEIIDICNETKNKHFIWFTNLLGNHFEGIIAHAALTFSSGKIEGINSLIKTIRCTGYGYPDDDYFFLKIMDQSRKTYIRNEKSHRKCD